MAVSSAQAHSLKGPSHRIISCLQERGNCRFICIKSRVPVGRNCSSVCKPPKDVFLFLSRTFSRRRSLAAPRTCFKLPVHLEAAASVSKFL